MADLSKLKKSLADVDNFLEISYGSATDLFYCSLFKDYIYWGPEGSGETPEAALAEFLAEFSVTDSVSTND